MTAEDCGWGGAAAPPHVPLRLAEPVCSAREALCALTDRRAQLVDMRKAEETRRQQIDDPDVRTELEDHLAELKRRIAHYDARIKQSLAAAPLAEPAAKPG